MSKTFWRVIEGIVLTEAAIGELYVVFAHPPMTMAQSFHEFWPFHLIVAIALLAVFGKHRTTR